MGNQSPAHGSLSAFTGGLEKEAGSIDLSYLAARWEKRSKEIPFELEVKHVLGQNSQIKMLELRGVWGEDGMQLHSNSDAQRDSTWVLVPALRHRWWVCGGLGFG